MEKIKPLKERHGFKVCFLSGMKEKSSVVRAIEAGGDDYIVKPIYPENLLSKIGILLRNLDLIEGYHLLRCNIPAKLVGGKIIPDIQIRAIDELSIIVYSSAHIEPESQLEIQSQKLSLLLDQEENFSVKVNKCRESLLASTSYAAAS